MQEVFARIEKVARTDATVLVLGESGTGKELVARAIHTLSDRRGGALVAVNCASIPESLIESELFGHARGAFTGAVRSREGLITAADGGTLFLDEVGELPLEAQARLLRVLEEGEIRPVGAVTPRAVDLRLIAATHRDLPALVETGRFREDLFFRLHVMTLRLPALRERGDDVERLAHWFLARASERLHKPRLELGPEAMRLIRAHSWPGNVRELENAIERAAILCDGDTIMPEHLDIPPVRGAGGAGSPPSHPDLVRSPAMQAPGPGAIPAGSGAPGEGVLDSRFREFVLLNQHHLTETELARQLGISRKTLWERRRRLGIPRPGRAERALDRGGDES